MNSYDVVKEAFITKGTEFAHRNEITSLDLFQNDTIFNTGYSATYKESRKTASQIIRKLLSTKFDDIYENEMVKIQKYFDENDGPLDLSEPIASLFGNVTTCLAINKTYAYDDKDFLAMRRNFAECIKLSAEVSVGDLFIGGPLKVLVKLLTINKLKRTEQITKLLLQIFYDHIHELQSSNENHGEPRDIVEAYLRTGHFTDVQIASTVFTLIPDAMLSSPEVCQWLFAYLLNYPKYQEMILEEIQDVVGSGSISVSHRPRMPVTEAFIVEVLRIKTPFAIGMLNKALKDTTLRGYSIPKNVTVSPNYYYVNHDPRNFPEPNVFKPERFINEGRIGNMEAFVTFGVGRRMCVGETIVRNNLFMFLTNMIQKYQITPASGRPPSLEKAADPLMTKVRPFKVILKRRL